MSLRNAFEDLATEKGLTLLRRIFQALKPLGVVTGSGSNRLSVDVNNVTGGTLIATQATAGNLNCTATIASGTVTTVTTVATMSNQTNIGGVSAFEMLKAMSRTGYNQGIRSRIT